MKKNMLDFIFEGRVDDLAKVTEADKKYLKTYNADLGFLLRT